MKAVADACWKLGLVFLGDSEIIEIVPRIFVHFLHSVTTPLPQPRLSSLMGGNFRRNHANDETVAKTAVGDFGPGNKRRGGIVRM